MKKVFALLLIGSFALTSCGPRRYKCGPYRKCEKEIQQNTKQSTLKNEKTYTRNS